MSISRGDGSEPLAGHALETPLASPFSNACFGCGPANETGIGMSFFATQDKPGHVFCRITLSHRFEGPPRHAHGGIVATLLDEAMGKANALAGVLAMTRTMEISYRKPVPLEQEILIEGWNERREGRKHFNAARIVNVAGDVLATATGLFIAVDRDNAMAALNSR